MDKRLEFAAFHSQALIDAQEWRQMAAAESGEKQDRYTRFAQSREDDAKWYEQQIAYYQYKEAAE